MRRLISCIVLWIVVISLALGSPQTITRYVDTDGGNNANDGTSWEQAWASQSYARAQFKLYGENGDGDFTATGTTYPEGIMGHLYCRGSTLDTVAVTWDVVTSATNYMKVIGDGDYTLSVPGASGFNGCAVYTDAIIFENVHFARSSATANDQACVKVQNVGAGGFQRFIACGFIGAESATYSALLFFVNDGDAVAELNNCKFVDAGDVANSRGIFSYSGTVYVYNCTIDNCYYGIDVYNVASAKAYGKNTIVTGSAGNAYNKGASGTLQLTYCTADDATATPYDTGSTCTDNVSPTFTGDYQLASTDTTWIDGGMDLSSDGHWHDNPVDAWDTTRPQGSAWDIGWHEYISTDDLVLLRRRRMGD